MEGEVVLGTVCVDMPYIELWYNGTKLWWCHLGSAVKTVAEGVGLASDYCFAWSGVRPNITFTGGPHGA